MSTPFSTQYNCACVMAGVQVRVKKTVETRVDTVQKGIFATKKTIGLQYGIKFVGGKMAFTNKSKIVSK